MVPNTTKGSIQGLDGQIIYRERELSSCSFLACDIGLLFKGILEFLMSSKQNNIFFFHRKKM